MRSILRLQQAHVPQHYGMIPIDALTGKFIAAKRHNDDNIHGDFFVRWGDMSGTRRVPTRLRCHRSWPPAVHTHEAMEASQNRANGLPISGSSFNRSAAQQGSG